MNTAPNPSLQKKSAARTAAVQCLYQNVMAGEIAATEHVAALKNTLADNRDEQKLRAGSAVEPNYKLLETLLDGVSQNLEEIDSRLNGILRDNWKRERISPLLIAILQCAIFELSFSKDIKPNIVIDEYTRLARSFFADAEVSFVNGALKTLAQQYG